MGHYSKTISLLHDTWANGSENQRKEDSKSNFRNYRVGSYFSPCLISLLVANSKSRLRQKISGEIFFPFPRRMRIAQNMQIILWKRRKEANFRRRVFFPRLLVFWHLNWHPPHPLLARIKETFVSKVFFLRVPNREKVCNTVFGWIAQPFGTTEARWSTRKLDTTSEIENIYSCLLPVSPSYICEHQEHIWPRGEKKTRCVCARKLFHDVDWHRLALPSLPLWHLTWFFNLLRMAWLGPFGG